MERGRGEPNFGLPLPHFLQRKWCSSVTHNGPFPRPFFFQKENSYFFLFLKIGGREVRGEGSILPGAKEKNEERERG